MAYDTFDDTGAIVQLFEGQDIYLVKQGQEGIGFPFEGNNTNGVAILYSTTGTLAPEDREQMTKILAALKLAPTDIALINIAEVPSPAFSTIVRQVGCKYLIIFGPTPADMSMLVAAKRYIELRMTGTKVLFADSLEVLRQDAQRKRYLWDCLQVMFGLK